MNKAEYEYAVVVRLYNLNGLSKLSGTLAFD